MGRPKPFDPAAAERARQARLNRDADRRAQARYDDDRPESWGVAPDALRLPANADVEAARDGRGRVTSAHRSDVFERLHARGGLSVAELAAVRRLQGDMGARAGLFRPEAGLVYVDQQGSSEGVTQRMVAAGRRVERALALVGPRQALLLRGLLEPATTTGSLVDWRAVVARETAETNPNVQAALIRAAADNLALAYRAVDTPPRGRG